jgi:hypothetical protein
MTNIDWNSELDKVDEATKPIAEGPASFRIVEAKPTKASSSGNPMIRLSAKVEGGPDDGKVAFVNLVFPFDNPRAMKMTLRRLTGLGISADLLKAENPSIEQIAAKLIGRLASGTVTHREWNGEVQNDVDFVGSAMPSGVPDAPSIPKPDIPDAVAVTPAAAATPAAAPVEAEAEPPKPGAF